MSRPASTHTTTPESFRISERDLTEIQLHSVDSINDLHREHGPRGMRPPLSPGHSPLSNGNLGFLGMADVNQIGRPIESKLQNPLRDTWWTASMRVYVAASGVILTLLLMLLVMVYLLVKQGGAIWTLTEALRERQDVSMEISLLIQELQALRHNLTALKDRP